MNDVFEKQMRILRTLIGTPDFFPMAEAFLAEFARLRIEVGRAMADVQRLTEEHVAVVRALASQPEPRTRH